MPLETKKKKLRNRLILLVLLSSLITSCMSLFGYMGSLEIRVIQGSAELSYREFGEVKAEANINIMENDQKKVEKKEQRYLSEILSQYDSWHYSIYDSTMIEIQLTAETSDTIIEIYRDEEKVRVIDFSNNGNLSVYLRY